MRPWARAAPAINCRATRVSAVTSVPAAAAARPRQLHGVLGVTAGHQGCDGAKGFGGVNGRGFVRLRAEQQGGWEECAGRLQISFTTQTDLAARGQQMIDFFLHVSTLLTADESPHLHPFLGRIADDHVLQPRNQRPADGFNLRFRHDDAADGGTFCPALAVISRTTSRINSVNSGCSGVTSSPSTQQLRESASMVNGMECATIFGWTRRLCPVLADPVNVTTSGCRGGSADRPRHRRSG